MEEEEEEEAAAYPAAARAPPLSADQLSRLRDEQGKVVTSCQEKIQHWKKVENDYEALQERLSTLPDKLSYDIMVPFGPLAFMPGRLVHTNEITVLLGENWFAKCSAKQASTLVEHRKQLNVHMCHRDWDQNDGLEKGDTSSVVPFDYKGDGAIAVCYYNGPIDLVFLVVPLQTGDVRKMLSDLQKVMKNFESRVEFTEDLQKMSSAAGDFVDIREVIESNSTETKGKHRTAHKPHSKPKPFAFEANRQENGAEEESSGGLKSDEELWARLHELEKQEEMLGELDRISHTVEANGQEAYSSEEEKEDKKKNVNVVHEEEEPNTQGNFQTDVTNSELFRSSVNGSNHYCSDDDDDLAIAENAVPTIYFSHTVEPKRVRINTGKNTTLKFSEKKEEAKRKRKNSNGNGHSSTELPNIKTPADIYRVFVDIVNGEYVPRKSILKSRSRENSVCSDTSESSTAEFDDRRGILRSMSYDEATYSDNSEGILEGEGEEGEQEYLSRKMSPLSGICEAFLGTVVEKEPLSSASLPHPVIAHPVLPTIPERKAEEVLSEASEETTKRVSKFKAARMQQKT